MSHAPGSAAALSTIASVFGSSAEVSGTGAWCQQAMARARASIANKGRPAARIERRARSDAPKVSAGTGNRSVSGRSARQWRSS